MNRRNGKEKNCFWGCSAKLWIQWFLEVDSLNPDYRHPRLLFVESWYFLAWSIHTHTHTHILSRLSSIMRFHFNALFFLAWFRAREDDDSQWSNEPKCIKYLKSGEIFFRLLIKNMFNRNSCEREDEGMWIRDDTRFQMNLFSLFSTSIYPSLVHVGLVSWIELQFRPPLERQLFNLVD